MQVAAFLHGEPGRLPFVGHFRTSVQVDGVTLAAAGRVAGNSNVAVAFRAAREIETALQGIGSARLSNVDRHSVLRAAWNTLADIEACDLGPNGGDDLSIIITVKDDSGMGVAAVGIGGLWSWQNNTLLPLVEGQHPLLGPPGRPDEAPGVLTLDAPVHAVVATPHHRSNETPQIAGLARAVGMNP
ncbi:MAG: hypothetical protein ACPGTU_03165 [Myxococcota bacterium]